MCLAKRCVCPRDSVLATCTSGATADRHMLMIMHSRCTPPAAPCQLPLRTYWFPPHAAASTAPRRAKAMSSLQCLSLMWSRSSPRCSGASRGAVWCRHTGSTGTACRLGREEVCLPGKVGVYRTDVYRTYVYRIVGSGAGGGQQGGASLFFPLSCAAWKKLRLPCRRSGSSTGGLTRGWHGL